ncbi:MAG: hypothetical protein HOW97_34130 [Catenulispora sp.]|nr:hypothetical protein [Catenulispora sp.]
MPHWHAYTYTGHTRPPDREARDPNSPTPPLVVADWPRKPRSMLAGTFTAVDDAMGWLAKQLADTPPLTTAIAPELIIGYARERLTQEPGDQVTRYYTAGSYACRDLVRCPPAGPCPDPPEGAGR